MILKTSILGLMEHLKQGPRGHRLSNLAASDPVNQYSFVS